MSEIIIVPIDKEAYINIIRKTSDANVEHFYWDYPCCELSNLIEEFKDTSYEHRHFALFMNKLWELPEDWKNIINSEAKEKEYLKYLDCDFYEVEIDDNGKKVIHSNGYYYLSESGEEKCYRSIEYDGLYLDPEMLRNQHEYYDESQEIVKQYIYDFNEEDIIINIKHDLEDCIPLLMKEVTNDTPCGKYVDIKN